MSVIGGQQVLPIGIAVGVGVALVAVGGRQQIARPVVGEGIGGRSVGGSRQLAQRIIGVAPCPAAGGLLRDVPGGVVGEAAADLLLTPEGADEARTEKLLLTRVPEESVMTQSVKQQSKLSIL